jgi:hypothetical protein
MNDELGGIRKETIATHLNTSEGAEYEETSLSQ